MKLFRRKTWILISGGAFAALLIALFIHSFVLSVNAVDNSYTIRILEITDPTSTASLKLDDNDNFPNSELDKLQGVANVKIDTMTMKRFVSLRDNWDGKYDAVYIGKGLFSPKLINSNSNSTQDERKAAHKSIDVENDITLLKAKELTDYYISKGLNVFFREETFTQQDTAAKRGVLYSTFNSYRASSPANVTFVKNLAALNTLTAAIKDGSWNKISSLKQRPRLTISNKPASYSASAGSTTVYQSGDKLDFSLQIDNVSDLRTTPVRVKLYINVDSSLPVTEDNVVVSKELTSLSDTISYTLPTTFSGPLYWRLEASTLTGFKDFTTGDILYKGEKTKIKVLQIMPAGKTESDLLSTTNNNMKKSYLSNGDYYELEIIPHDMSWFNNYIASKASATDKTSGLNGNFDMIVFGFLDMYDRATTPMLSEAAAIAVKAFAEETKQSLMLTHDTIFRDANAPFVESGNNKNYWSYYFHDMVGQALPRTYLGGNAIYTSTKVSPVNQGLLTQYPFNLDTTGTEAARYTVATTHDQFFPLNLERADVIPWYNIIGSDRDIDDSYNHFYTYSVGNITFSGTGHTSKNFPDWEQKLFVNTMYRAFTGANHAPKITVYTPQDKSTKPSYHDKLTVSYSATDLDLKDKELTTEIKIKKLVGDENTGTYVQVDAMPQKTVRSGETVTQIFNNPLLEGGKLQIEITAKDKQGALDSKIINVTVEKVTANLSISRSISSAIVEKGEPLTITYNVKPNVIPASTVDKGDQGVQKLEISDIQYSEVFPATLEFRDLSALGLTQSGNAASGYTLTKNLGKLTYHLSEDGLTYIPDLAEGISFTVKAVPTEKIHYLLDNSNLSFEDLHSQMTATTAPADSKKIFSTINSISSEFNAFLLGNVYINSARTEGRIAAGGNAEFQSYTLNGKGGTGNNALVVDGNFNFNTNNGATINGNVVYGGTYLVSPNNTAVSVTPGKIINFTETGNFLKLQSNLLASTTGTMNTDFNFIGTHADSNVFTVNPNTATTTGINLNNIKINAPQTSTVVINVYGKSISISGGFDLTNIQNSNIILNFPEAETIRISSVAVKATVLAPSANVQFDSGDIYGSLIAKELRTNNGGTLNLGVFKGTLPPVTISPPTPSPTPVLPRVTMEFDDLSFDSIVKVTGVTLTGGTISINTSLNMQPLAVILPADASPSISRWESLNPGIATVSNSGMVLGVAPGTATIKLTVTDASGTTLTATADVTVITPELNISGPTEVLINTSADYQATYNTANDTVREYKWSIKEGDNNAAGAKLSVDVNDPLKSLATLVANKSGTVTLVAVAITDTYPGGSAPKEHKVTFINPVQEIAISGPDLVNVNEKIPLTITVVRPSNADPAQYTWSLVGNSGNYAAIIPGANTTSIELKGLKVTDDGYPVIVKASLNGTPTGSPVEATFSVTVGTRVTGLKLTDSVDIGVGEKNALNLFDINHLTVFPDTIQLPELVGKLEWTSSNPAVVTVTAGGKITGIVKGSATVTVTLKDNPSITSSVKVNVINEDRY